MRYERLSIPGAVSALKQDTDHNLFLFANAKEIYYAVRLQMKILGHTVNQASIHFLRLSCFLSFWSLWKSPTRTPKGALPMFSGGWGYVGFSSTCSAWRLGDGAGVGCIISVANNLIFSLCFFTSSLEVEFRGNCVQLTCSMRQCMNESPWQSSLSLFT